MKNIFIFIFSILVFTLNSQTVYSAFAGYGNVAAVTGTGPIVTLTVQNFVGNSQFEPNGQYLAVDVQVGDVLWVNCTRWVITTINGVPTGTTMNITLEAPAVDWAIGISTPSNGQRVAVVRENEGTLPALTQTGDGNNGPVSGVTNDLYTCMVNHYQQALLNNSNSLNEIAFTSGLTAPANSVATVQGYKLAKNNMGDGDLYRWNGTAWVLVGGSTPVDQSIDVAFTPGALGSIVIDQANNLNTAPYSIDNIDIAPVQSITGTGGTTVQVNPGGEYVTKLTDGTTVGQVKYWNGTTWVNSDATVPTSGQALTWNGTNWTVIGI